MGGYPTGKGKQGELIKPILYIDPQVMEGKVENKQGDKVVSPNIYVNIYIAMPPLSQVKLGVRFKPRGTTGCLSCLQKLQWKGERRGEYPPPLRTRGAPTWGEGLLK